MPVKKCHKLGTKYYCYNKDDKTVSVFTEQICQPSECPDTIISRLIAKDEDVYILIKDATEAVALSSDDLTLIISMLKEKTNDKAVKK